jgi:hypothetical protein
MTLTSSPKLIKGGLAVLDGATGTVTRTIALQYNPDTLTRSYQIQGVGGEGESQRAQPFRFKGPATESIKLEAQIDATDHGEQSSTSVERSSSMAARISKHRDPGFKQEASSGAQSLVLRPRDRSETITAVKRTPNL